MDYLTSPSAEPLLTLTFADLLDQAATSWPDKDAYVFSQTGSRVTFAGLKEQADRLAGGLLAIGIGRGDHVGWVAANRPEWLAIFFAVMKIGAVAVPQDLCFFEYKETTAVNVLNKAEVKVLIVEAREDGSTPYHDMFGATGAGERLPHLTTLVTIGESKHRDCFTLSDLLQKGGEQEFQQRLAKLQAELSCHDLAILQLTSGTTGLSKLVEMTTHAILNSNRYVAQALHMDQQCRAAFATLFSNIAWNICHPIIVGCTFVVTSTEEPDAEGILSAVQEEKCTMIYSLYVKNFYTICNYPDLQSFDLSSLKLVMTGGNIVSKALITTSAQELPNVIVINVYGSTETGFVTATVAEMTSEARNTTVGAVLPHLQLKITDDDGNSVPRNTIGEVTVRGYSVFQQYYGDPAKTEAAKTKDGWYGMGDMGFIGDDGLVRITGRKKEMIIKDSDNIFPGMIEGPLQEHPAVKDVKVVGVPDAVYGEELCACIILKSGEGVGEDEMKQFASAQGLIEEYNPGHILFVDEFPKTTNGRKVDRRKLRSVAMERLGLKELDS
ncbi:putative acyl-CoA synthetase YngI [Branchiostoma floridae x Branchiostoma belcheri]